VTRNREHLAERPVWLFSSGPLDDQPGAEPAQVRGFAGAIRQRGHRVFAGALDPGRLGSFERFVVRRVEAPDGDFRPWDEIDEWADDIAAHLAGTRLRDEPRSQAAITRRAGTAGTGR
jgi:menaquinone-dependent protoporphyrinogen oxidase